jgi:hypothetical protein
MKASASSLLFLLCTGTTSVYAQDAGATLNEKNSSAASSWRSHAASVICRRPWAQKHTARR